jgi:hypothetical protein
MSKILDSVIEKYQLNGTTAQIGEAFIHNLRSFESRLPEFKEIMFMECDFDGKPCEFITLYKKTNRRYSCVSNEYLLDMSSYSVLKNLE